MSSIRVGVLRGGPSSEYDVSLKTGAEVLRNINDPFVPVDIYIDKKGVWHLHGVERHPQTSARNIDVVFNAMHGEYGEDGRVQQLLDALQIPYTGSTATPSAAAMNKWIAKDIYRKNSIRTPKAARIRKDVSDAETLAEVFHGADKPVVVKPTASGSSVGVCLVDNFSSFCEAVDRALMLGESALVEERILGREATCGVIEGFRGEELYTLPPVEIIPPSESGLFDYNAKYSGATIENCPGNFSREEKEALQRIAVDAHKALGLRHYSRTDFILAPKNELYALETNTLPGLTQQSLFPKSLGAVGADLSVFISHILGRAMGLES